MITPLDELRLELEKDLPYILWKPGGEEITPPGKTSFVSESETWVIIVANFDLTENGAARQYDAVIAWRWARGHEEGWRPSEEECQEIFEVAMRSV